MAFFVTEDSVVRKIWGQSDTILFIFVGAAAEFALNKAVDWLFYTGKLPDDPLGRLFSTVGYARQIVFSEENRAFASIDKIKSIHGAVEQNRGYNIPDWAYQDVLYMLIDYSIRSFELLERKLTMEEKEEVFKVFCRVGERMGIPALPVNYSEWEVARQQNMEANLLKSTFTRKLFSKYQEHLGTFRYKMLLEAQILVVPEKVRTLLELRSYSFLRPTVFPYRIARKIKMDRAIKNLLLPEEYKQQIAALDIARA